MKGVSDPYLDILGQRIRTRRRELGMSQEGLAHEAGLDRSYVGRIERGEHNLTFVSLVRLARAMGCDVATLTDAIPLIHQRQCGVRNHRLTRSYENRTHRNSYLHSTHPVVAGPAKTEAANSGRH
jgi:transcriptional regulator with XRE-family HTH domain